MRHPLLVVLVPLVACGPIRPREGPPLPAVPEPALPVIPPVTSAGCVGSADDEVEHVQVWQDVHHYQDAWLARATARRGWTALPPAITVVQIVNSTRSGFDLMSGELLLRAERADMLVDEHGQRWLKTRLRFQCTREQPRFYADGDLGVFEIDHRPHCLETHEVALCGVYAAGGCGIDPTTTDAEAISEWFFVPVPRGAHWLGIRDITIRDDVPVCLVAKPAGVTTPP